MAKKPATIDVREAARKVAVPFWQHVETAGIDRFLLDRLLRGLLRRFREDRFARVKQGGLHGDARTELSRVFIDLDATPGASAARENPSTEPKRIVASWMHVENESFAHRGQGAIPDLAAGMPRMALPLEVVLGGPGQGKSTVGRFLVLIHASILLLTSPLSGIASPADMSHIEAFLASLAGENIDFPDQVRLPIWIELRELAGELLRSEDTRREPLPALFHWIATNDLRESTDAGALESLLDSVPWVLVLDGLDEVPPQEGRTLVRGCVDAVRRRFAGENGLLIGTSRPQSYDREVFGEALFERTLLPLSKKRAEVYAERFAECLHEEEEDQRASLLKGMRKALVNPSTAALMTNPLLVTIMAAIILHHGEPSDRRWPLFEEYYHTLYRRETERGTFASSTLRQHETLISAIHRHVGMSLQARSEDAGGVSAWMPEQELRTIIHDRLLEGFSEEEATRLTEEVLRAAEQRLVLLVQPQKGMYGFDLRSFQEMMAAWQIVSLKEGDATALLRRVAPLRAWQNVVLFAIGHQYAKGSPLARERSVGLCEWLDRDEEDGRGMVLPGARLALALLGDAPYGKASRPQQELAAKALDLLRVPAEAVHLELANLAWGVEPDRLLEALGAAVADPDRGEAAWMMLLDLPEDDRVTGVVDARWPVDEERRREIVRGYAKISRERRGRRPPGPQASRKVLAERGLHDPRDLRFLLVDADAAKLSISHGFGGDGYFVGPRHAFRLAWWCGGVSYLDPDARAKLERIPEAGTWALWRAAMVFRAEPTATKLATVLEDLSRHWTHRAAWYSEHSLPWPLLVCMMAAQSEADLQAIAARLRSGELGSGSMWIEKQESGYGRHFHWVMNLAALRRLSGSADPLRDILRDGRAPPFSAAYESSLWSRDTSGLRSRHLRELCGLCRAATAPWVRRMVAQLLFTLAEGLSSTRRDLFEPNWLSAKSIVDLVNVAEMPLALTTLAAFGAPLDSPKIAAILTQTQAPIVATAKSYLATSPSFLTPLLVEALARTPESPRLQRALVVALQYQASEENHAPGIHVQPQGDTPDAHILRFLSGHATPADIPIFARILTAPEAEAQSPTTSAAQELTSTLTLLDAHPLSRPFVLPLIDSLLALPNAPSALRSAAVQFLAARIERAPSGLASPEQWAITGLPAPPPMLTQPERRELPGAQFASLEITNLRAFPQRLEIKAPAPEGSGQWMVFLGENATGKTTLLRAVAMALASPSDAAAVPSNLDGPLRRDPSRDGSVRVVTRDNRNLTTTVTGPADNERVVATPEDALRPWVVGYGCRRGSAVSGTDMDNAFVPFRDLDNLFDRPRGVIRASGWLKELQRLAKNNGARSRLVFEAARAALRDVLLGADAVTVENEVSVVFKDNRTVPLALLSDGYLTTAGWIVDLMARWIKRNEGRRNVDESFCSQMQGVVLLDEIDLHLHPRWQERVIEDVRKLFPKMTFLATTHHPLTLRGARKGEVFILGDHDNSGSISAIQRDIPPGTRVDELLTGTWFNRPSAIIDEETRRMLHDHQRLILSGAKAGDPARKTLESKLRERLGRFADTSLERLAATIVAQHLDITLPEPSAEDRERVRKTVLGILDRRDRKRR